MKVELKGQIVTNEDASWIRSYFGEEFSVFCPKDLKTALDSGEDIELEINSPGGYIVAASEMYTALKDYSKNVVAKIVGFAGSCASWVAMAADEVQISPVGSLMIHNSSDMAWGDHRTMDSTAQALASIDDGIRNAYRLKTGMDFEKLEELMNRETYINAQKAVEYKFADKIMFDEEGILSPMEMVRDFTLSPSMIHNLVNLTFRKEEGKEMNWKDVTAEDLKKARPDLVDAISNLAKEEERKRIQNIEELGVSGFEQEIAKAKFETLDTPQNLAMNILKLQKEQNQKQFRNMKEDKEEVSYASPKEEKKNEEEDWAKLIAKAANKKKGA